MHRRFILAVFAIISSLFSLMAQRTGRMEIKGVECAYDTLQYRHIAPGATYLQVQFNSIKTERLSYKMRAHLIAVDLTNQFCSFSQYMAKGGKYYSISRQNDEVKWMQENGLKPAATLNGSGWHTATSGTNENSTPYELYEMSDNALIDREVKFAINQKEVNWFLTSDGKGHVGEVSLNASVRNASGESMAIGVINHFRDHTGENQLALFCNGIPKSRAVDATVGTDVILTKVDGGSILVGENKMVVKQVVNGCDHVLTAGEAILSGQGASERFLEGLQAGDEITINLGYNDGDGNSITPTSLRTNFRLTCIQDGVNQQSDRKYLATSLIGVSQDGNTVYLANMEMSNNSNAPEACFADFLIKMGVWDAMWLDGGVSAEMTVDGEYVTANTLGGRYIPAGFVVYSTAPDDNTLASVECPDLSSLHIERGASRNINLYGYNQYGEMIDAKAIMNPSLEVSCPSNLGYVKNGTFYATGNGQGTIDFRIKGQEGIAFQMPVVVTSDVSLDVYPKSFFTGEGRSYQATLSVSENGETIAIDPALATWTTDNPDVILSCENGLIVPFIDGYAEVYATYQGLTDTIRVTVENLPEEGIPTLDLTHELTTLYEFDYPLPSVPRGMIATIRNISREDVRLSYTTGDTLRILEIPLVADAPTQKVQVNFDYEAAGTYPVKVIDILPHDSAHIESLIACYDGASLTHIQRPKKSSMPYRITRQGGSVVVATDDAKPATITLYDLDGSIISQVKTNTTCTSIFCPVKTPVIVQVRTKDGVMTRMRLR